MLFLSLIVSGIAEYVDHINKNLAVSSVHAGIIMSGKNSVRI
jgi:hypothetical protein